MNPGVFLGLEWFLWGGCYREKGREEGRGKEGEDKKTGRQGRQRKERCVSVRRI